MKPKIITSILLFISSYSPLFIIFAVKDFDFVKTYKFSHPLPTYIMLGVTALSVILLFIVVGTIKRGSMCVNVLSVKNRSVDLINYTIPYMLSFFGIDLSKPQDAISLTIFMLIMLLLTITSKSIFINPILALVGYGLYDLEYRFDGRTFSTVVISKFDLNTGDWLYIRSLTKFLYFITEKRIDNDNES